MKDPELSRLKDEFFRLCPGNGDNADILEGVVFHKKEERTKCVIESFRPRVVLLIQGEKTAAIGSKVQQLFKEGDLICGGFELPEDDHYLEGTPDKPFLSLSFYLDQEISQSMLLKLPSSEVQVKTDPLRSDSASDRLLEAFVRLLRAAQTPLEQEILVPLIRREILLNSLRFARFFLPRNFHSGSTLCSHLKKHRFHSRKLQAPELNRFVKFHFLYVPGGLSQKIQRAY